MAESPTTKRKLVLLETDGVTVARVRRVAGILYDVCVELDAKRAMERVRTDQSVAVLIAGASGDGSSAVIILESIRTSRPDVLRIMLASPGHLGAVVRGLHSGAVERPAQKPIDEQELLTAILTPRSAATGMGLAAAAQAG
jgi:ActR/RegA family two-component response regulator